MLFLTITLLFPDTGSIDVNPVTGQVFFEKNNSIMMVWEDVFYDSTRITAVFSMSNTTSLTQKVKLGFPVNSEIDSISEEDMHLANTPGDYDMTEKSQLKFIEKQVGLVCTVDGVTNKQKLYHYKMVQDQYNNFNYVFFCEVGFKPYESKIINYTYYQAPMEDFWNTGMATAYRYILKTGATWKNPIKNAHITMIIPYRCELPPFQNKVMHYTPHDGITYFDSINYKITPEPDIITTNWGKFIIEWNFKNLIPTEDINVVYSCSIGFYLPDLVTAIDSENLKLFEDDFNTIKDFHDKDRFLSFIVTLGYAVKEHDSISGATNLMRFVINGMNALNGYKFKVKFWRDFFTQFKWYKPTVDKVEFTGADKIFVNTMLGIKMSDEEKNAIIKKQAVDAVKDLLKNAFKK